MGELNIRIKVPPLSLVTQVKYVTRFMSKKDEAIESDEVYLPKTRQLNIYMAVSSEKMIIKLQETATQVKIC